MRLKQKVSTSQKLSTKLINFLPFLKADGDELYEKIKEISKTNPLIEVKNKKSITFSNYKKAITDEIETFCVDEKSFYEHIIEEIESSNLFPTEKSKFIANLILENLSPDGYFEGNEEEIAALAGCSVEKVKKIRERFIYLNPPGVGAKDLKECFLFQLYALDDIDKETFELAKKMILKLEDLQDFSSVKGFEKALNVIKKFNISPANKFIKSEEIIPEIIIINRNGNLEISLNEDYYPEIYIKEENINDKFTKEKLKEARNVLDALEMRKATIKKIALMIVELQYDFFMGGVIKPMKIQDIADELELSASTVSRAISNKYLLCDRGTIPLKNFFSIALDDDISSAQIKEEIKRIIKNENKQKPLSDEKIADLINQKYNLKLVRRTITKYRESLEIPGSRERKKLYKLGINF
jgi:RNA polymerase sigma-54 factor